MRLPRRPLLLAGVAGGLGACARSAPSSSPGRGVPSVPLDAAQAATVTRLTALEQKLGGRLGVFARDTGSGAEIGHRSTERFAMCSTFKALLAGAVLSRVDAGVLALEQRVPYDEGDLLDYAPVTRAHLAAGALSIGELAAAAVQVSDNTAANLLLPFVGGPPGLTAFLRGLGDDGTRLDRDEPTLNTNLPGDPRDTTSPEAIARTLGKLVLDDGVLQATSRSRLWAWLEGAKTGHDRLRAGFPATFRVGHKTGTGARGAVNDVAIAWPPSGAAILVACLLDAEGVPPEMCADVHRSVAVIVADTFA